MSQISVNFKVQGNELSSYIDTITKKQQQMSDSAIKGAREQTASGKEQVEILKKQIELAEKKNKIEAQASIQILTNKRNEALNQSSQTLEGRKNDVFADTKLDEKSKREKITALGAVENDNQERIRNEFRDEVISTKEAAKTQKAILDVTKESVEKAQNQAAENIKAIKNGDKSLADIIKNSNTEEEKLVARLTEEGVKKEKQTTSSGIGTAGAFFAMEGANKTLSSVSSLASTNNGFDMIGKATSATYSTVLGVVAAGIGAMVSGGTGAIVGFNIGNALGKAIGDVKGTVDEREATTKQAFFKNQYRLSAISGRDDYGDTGNLTKEESKISNYLGFGKEMNGFQRYNNTSGAGVNIIDFLGKQGNVARQMGIYNGSAKTTADMIFLDKGLAIEESTSSAIIDMQRSSKEGNKDLGELVKAIANNGKDDLFKESNTFLNEFLNKFSSLQKELLKTQGTVASGTTMSILKEFSSLGNQWDVKDPRSAGLINTVNTALENPSGDFQKAFSFMTLKQLHPEMSSFDLIKEQQRGLASTGFLQGTLDNISKMGGSDDSKKFNVASQLGLNNNLDAAQKLWEGYKDGKLKNFDATELKNVAGIDLKGKAEENTSAMDKEGAKLVNGILNGEGINAMVKAFSAAMDANLSGKVIYMQNGSIELITKAGIIKRNVLDSAATYRMREKGLLSDQSHHGFTNH